MIDKALIYSVALAITLGSCQKPIEFDSKETPAVNQWLYNSFSGDYLWRAQMPPLDKTKLNNHPALFFADAIKHSADNYSFVSQRHGISPYGGRTALLGGSTTKSDFGMQVRLFENTMTRLINYGQIITVVNGSPAHRAGLRRGDTFHSINSIRMPMTIGNYITLLNQSTITLGLDKEQKVVELTRAEYINNPVLHDQLIERGSVRVGYIVYNHFSAGNRAELSAKLNEAFGRIGSSGVKDLILDLRYNSGGEIEECRHLASLIVKRAWLYSTFLYEEEASSYGNPDKFRPMYFLQPAAVDRYNISAQRLFILTSKNTASASEIIMHALKPLYGSNMVIVGQRSVGKNVGGLRYSSPDGGWDISKITVRIYDRNKISGYEQGITPDHQATEANELGDFGDVEQDNLLRKLFEEVYGVHQSSSNAPKTESINPQTEIRYLLDEPFLLTDCLEN